MRLLIVWGQDWTREQRYRLLPVNAGARSIGSEIACVCFIAFASASLTSRVSRVPFQKAKASRHIIVHSLYLSTARRFVQSFTTPNSKTCFWHFPTTANAQGVKRLQSC